MQIELNNEIINVEIIRKNNKNIYKKKTLCYNHN